MKLQSLSSVLTLLFLGSASTALASIAIAGAALTPRQTNPWDIGDPDPTCERTYDCDGKTTKFFSDCETPNAGDGTEVYICLCRMQEYTDLIQTCSKCYPEPKLAIDGWKGTCDHLGVQIEYSSTKGGDGKDGDKDNSAVERVAGVGLMGVGAVAAVVIAGVM